MTTTHATTLSPAAAILWAYRFAEDGTAQLVPGAEVDATLAAGTGWMWIHVGLADTRCRIWLERHAPVSAAAREILLGPDEHLRLDLTGDELAGVLPDLRREFAEASMEFARLRFVMTDNMLISARRHPLHSIELTHRSIEGGARFATPISLLDGIVDHFADSIARLAEQIADELDIVEDRVLRDDLGDERQRIARVRLQVMRVHRQLSPLKTLFHRLERRISPSHALLAGPLHALTQKLDALDHDFGSIDERSRLLQHEVATKMAAVTNRRLFTLSVLTACLLPPTLVTGFFGMNTKDLPFQQADGGTWYALVVAAGAGALTYWALQRLRAL
jgi:zinc transporter